MEKQRVAFFDIDGTIFRSSLLVELVNRLVADGVFPETTRSLYQSAHEAWQNREGTYETYIQGVIKAFVENLRGVHYGALADIGRMVVHEQSKHVYRYTRDLVSNLKAENYYLVAISQSPKFILDDFCDHYGFDKVYGRVYEIGPLDRFTGEVAELELIQDKAKIVRRVFERGDYSEDDSMGVGDTEGDIPLLESVAMPICFNPNMQLYTYAKGKKWPVIIERKDVVYTL